MVVVEKHLFGLDRTPNWIPLGVMIKISGERAVGVCGHGVDHIITVPKEGAMNGWLWTHLCDGCCAAWLDP